MSETLLSLLREPDLSWRDDAACAEIGDDFWFPEKGGSTREAKSICRRCEVRAECLQYALDNRERWGVWGGLSEHERDNLSKGRPLNYQHPSALARSEKPTPQPCGTPAAYKRHQRNGEDVDEQCRSAYLEHRLHERTAA